MACATREGAGGVSSLAPVRLVKSPTAWQVLYTIQEGASRRMQQRHRQPTFREGDFTGLGDEGSSALQRRSRVLGGPHCVRSTNLLHLRMRQNQHFLLFRFVESSSPQVGPCRRGKALRGCFLECGNGPSHKKSDYH